MSVKWTRRGSAFFIDYAIIVLLWSVVDNLVIFPVPEIIMALGLAVWFCLYFAVTEGSGEARASLGKRLTKFAVASEDGHPVSWRVVVVRSVILAAILVVDWEEVVLTPFPGAPPFVTVVAFSIPASLLVFNVWLAIWGPERLMLQDTLTSTKVTDQVVPRSTREMHITWPRPVVCAIIVAIGLGGSLVYSAIFVGEPLREPAQADVSREAESAIANELGVRSQVEIRERTTWRLGGGADESATRTLEIFLWLPWLAWDDATAQKAVEVVLDEFEPPGWLL